MEKTTLTATLGSTFQAAFTLLNAGDAALPLNGQEVWFQARDESDTIIIDSKDNNNIATIGQDDGDDAIIIQIPASIINKYGVGIYDAGISLIEPQNIAQSEATITNIIQFTLKIINGVPR